MATNAQLVGAVSVALDGSKVTAQGQFTTADGYPQSESVDLTVLMTAQTKGAVMQLLGALEQQYAIIRQNLLPQAKAILADQSGLAPVLGATVADDTTLAYTGRQSAKVLTPGAVVGEGVTVDLGSVPRGSTTTVTALVLIPTGDTIAATLTDTASQRATYTAVSPATTPPSYSLASTPIAATASATGTGEWQAITLTLPVGATSAPSLTLSLATARKQSLGFWLGAVQLMAQGE